MISKILLPTNPQPDTVIAISLLKIFGHEKYPGVENATVETAANVPSGETSESLESAGVLVLDLGGGKFDHHNRNTTASNLVAENLGLLEYAPISKLLAYAERDDKYGRGTISEDPLDRAFGFSAIVSVLNRAFANKPNDVVNYLLPFVWAHYLEEKRRLEDLPQEFKKKLDEGAAEVFDVRHKGKRIKVVLVQSDNPSMVGWLRSNDGLKADVVAQKTSGGYVNILTKQIKRINLSLVAAFVREEELRSRDRRVFDRRELMRPGRVDAVPEWYYDRATNSLLNGSLSQRGISPTAIPFEKFKDILTRGLGEFVFEKRPFQRIAEKSNYFLEIRVPLEAAEKLKSFLPEKPLGFKLHRSENYHIALLYLGSCHTDELVALKDSIRRSLRAQKPFEVSISGADFKSGPVPGYQEQPFYFEVGDSLAFSSLTSIHTSLKDVVPRFIEQEFKPYIVVASAIRSVDEKVLNDARLEVAKDAHVNFFVDKIRLTEIQKGPLGEVIYKKAGEFDLTKNS